MIPKLYQMLTKKQMEKFAKEQGFDLSTLPVTEVKTDTLFGDFVSINDYEFKMVYSKYHCLKTPTQKHVPILLAYYKAKNDIYKK